MEKEDYQRIAEEAEKDMRKQRQALKRGEIPPPPIDIRFVQRRQMNRPTKDGK